MGLIKTGLKAAVFVKTAHVVHDRIERRQQAQWAAQGQPAVMAPGGPPPNVAQPQWSPDQAAATASPPAPAPAGPPGPIPQPSILDQLTQLGELRAGGVLTDAEFEAQKARILGG
jgi:hypothetical protein